MSRARLGLTCAAFILTLSGCTGLAAGSGDQTTGRPARATAAAESRTPAPTRPPPKVADLVGEDGRLTVLILGSDVRKGIIGERTDTIIVATIDPVSGKVALVSLPRDTVNVPIAPGIAYPQRINSLYFDLQQSSGKAKVALTKLREALAYAFDTQIDFYVLVDFDGLVQLIDSIGGIEVSLDEPLIDASMHLGTRGLRLRAGTPRLSGREALAFSRSRHTDSDYDRSRRQQQVLVAVAEKVRQRGLSALPALVELARKKTLTDIPLRAAPALLELASRADLSDPRSVVLEPIRWARELPSTYTISPRVLEVQKLFDRLFDSLG
ncbi:MAG TPA: LCP family protein [Candidatus Limnocylindrales bacterium]|nr:LCP family protein [Candidatus Limnocylindrales bacterium]